MGMVNLLLYFRIILIEREEWVGAQGGEFGCVVCGVRAYTLAPSPCRVYWL